MTTKRFWAIREGAAVLGDLKESSGVHKKGGDINSSVGGDRRLYWHRLSKGVGLPGGGLSDPYPRKEGKNE